MVLLLLRRFRPASRTEQEAADCREWADLQGEGLRQAEGLLGTKCRGCSLQQCRKPVLLVTKHPGPFSWMGRQSRLCEGICV